MQTIQTKFIGPTNTRPDRVKASCDVSNITVSWDYGLNSDENHMAAADQLRVKLGWNQKCYSEMVGGHTRYGMVFVFVSDLYTLNSRIKKAA